MLNYSVTGLSSGFAIPAVILKIVWKRITLEIPESACRIAQDETELPR
jgi:hypothetical protein